MIPEYACICLNMLEYVWIYRNTPKSAWIASVLDFLICFIIPCLLEHVIIAWIRNMRLFPWRDTIWYFYSSWKYLIFFLFRLNIFTCKITFLVREMEWWVGGRKSWYTLLVFCSFLVKTCKEIKKKLSHICKIIDI